MHQTLVQRKNQGTPLPIKGGLNPSRVRLPLDEAHCIAWDFLTRVISAQRHRHPQDNDTALHKRFAAGEVVDRAGRQLKPGDVIAPGEDIWFYRIPAPETHVPYDISTVYEDDDLLVVNKPPFLATMPRAQHITETATVRLRRETGNNELSPAHRLDRLTSGLLLFTKRREIRGAYQRLFADRKVSKTYEALATFGPELEGITWENRIEKTPGEFQARIVEGTPNAITRVVSVERLDAQLEERIQRTHGVSEPLGRYVLSPATGKTHQLRLHMHASGHPILGDNAYPTPQPIEKEDFQIPLRLTATRLEFVDPFTSEQRVFSL